MVTDYRMTQMIWKLEDLNLGGPKVEDYFFGISSSSFDDFYTYWVYSSPVSITIM